MKFELLGRVTQVRTVDTRIHATIDVDTGPETTSELVLELTPEQSEELHALLRTDFGRPVRVTVDV
jgi:hypothetical protein